MPGLIKIMELPTWLQPPRLSYARYDTYTEATLEKAFFHLRGGVSIVDICEDADMPDYRELLGYIMRNPSLKEKYYEAQETGAEILAENVLVEARGGNKEIPDEVSRSALIVKALMWKAEKQSPKRYGPRTQTEVTYTYDLSEAMRKAQERFDKARVIDGEATRLE